MAARTVVTEQGKLTADIPSFANPSLNEQQFAGVLSTQIVAQSMFATSVSGLPTENAMVSHDYSASENTSLTDLSWHYVGISDVPQVL